MPDIARIQRQYSRHNLDRVVRIGSEGEGDAFTWGPNGDRVTWGGDVLRWGSGGKQVWAKRIDDGATEDVRAVDDTLAVFPADELHELFIVHHDAAIVPGETLTDDGETLTIDSVQEIGRRRYMLLRCSASTPATPRDLIA